MAVGEERSAGCHHRRFFDDVAGRAVTWTPLTPGVHLNSWDAVITCADSLVVFASNVRFGSPSLTWVSREAEHFGTIPANMLIVFYPMSRQQENTAEVREVRGNAYYSRDRELFRQSRISESRSGTETDAWVIEENRRRAETYEALHRMPWAPLAEGDVLSAWDMLWTRPGGRCEIEIIGRNRLIEGSRDFIDKDGRPTGRKRFPSKAYWILLPDLYDAAQATRVLGEVWKSTDPDQVKQFFETYRISGGMSHDPAVEGAERQAENQLRREDPEAFKRWWAESVRQSHAEYQRWHDSLRGAQLE